MVLSRCAGVHPFLAAFDPEIHRSDDGRWHWRRRTKRSCAQGSETLEARASLPTQEGSQAPRGVPAVAADGRPLSYRPHRLPALHVACVRKHLLARESRFRP